MTTGLRHSHAHSPDALIASVGNVKIPVLIKANPRGAIELSAFRWTAIAAKTSLTSPRNDFDGVGFQIQTSHPMAAGFGKAQNFGRLKGQPGGLQQIGQNGCDAPGFSVNEENTPLFPF